MRRLQSGSSESTMCQHECTLPDREMSAEKAKRLVMVRSTDLILPRKQTPADMLLRNLKSDDFDALGDLLYHAYLNTVDDEGGTLDDAKQEALDTMNGRYGGVLFPASFVFTRGSEICCATVVTNFEKTGPLLAFIATRPDSQRLGLGRSLISETMRILSRRGIRKLRLVVTEANTVALNLYLDLGFVIENEKEQ